MINYCIKQYFKCTSIHVTHDINFFMDNEYIIYQIDIKYILKSDSTNSNNYFTINITYKHGNNRLKHLHNEYEHKSVMVIYIGHTPITLIATYSSNND